MSPQLTDTFCDEVVEILFHAVPCMDGQELGILLRLLFAATDREVHRHVTEERERQQSRLDPCSS